MRMSIDALAVEGMTLVWAETPVTQDHTSRGIHSQRIA
jgi:hypothetical protein